MSEMFEDADAFNGDVSTFNTTSVTNMRKMFRHAVSFTGVNGLSTWQTSNVVDTSEMFLGTSSFSGEGLSLWTISSLQTANLMVCTTIDSSLTLWQEYFEEITTYAYSLLFSLLVPNSSTRTYVETGMQSCCSWTEPGTCLLGPVVPTRTLRTLFSQIDPIHSASLVLRHPSVHFHQPHPDQ